MGAFASRRNAGVEEVDYSTTNAYRYPPKSGCYFGSYFIMGGERFDTTQPEAYLFGENQDLNFLGNRPIPFPYPAPQANEPTKTLKSLVNIRKDSLRFVRVAEQELGAKAAEPEDGQDPPAQETKYNIEFTFDTDVRVAITVYYFATEEINAGQAVYHPRDSSMNSETFHYKRGANQTFSQSTHILDPSIFPEEEWQYNPDKDLIPIVLQCVVEDEVDHAGHSHMTFATVEKSSDGGYNLKPLKQKQMVDGLCYLLQEIYGIENKNVDRAKPQDDEIEDSGSECVICMSDIRDTLILPCRHLCLCNGCADSLRYQANNCPICRAPFRALLQIRAMRKKLPSPQPPAPGSDSEENTLSQEGVPAGYEAVSLLEALNGPMVTHTPHGQVHMPAEPLTTPTSLPPPSSLPTSPDDSPKMEKRKSKRQSSTRSRRSVASAALVEQAEEAMEDGARGGGDRCATPEVIMIGELPDPVKGEKQTQPVVPKVKTPPPPPSTVPPTPGSPKNNLRPESDKEDNLNSLVTMEQGVADATPRDIDVSTMTPMTAVHSAPTPSPDYEDAVEGPDQSVPQIQIRPHTAVMYEQDHAIDLSSTEDDPCLPSQSDAMSLPGTPASTTDGSSYSSTNSSRGLLHQIVNPTDTTGDAAKPEQ